MDPETKVCPHCGKQIKTIARKCRWCKRFVDCDSEDQESTADVTRIQIAICFIATCCVPVPNIWAGGAIAPFGIWYLGLISPLLAPPLIPLLVAHIFLCRFITRWIVKRVRTQQSSVNDKAMDENSIVPTDDQP